jgi:hypothetical protein
MMKGIDNAQYNMMDYSIGHYKRKHETTCPPGIYSMETRAKDHERNSATNAGKKIHHNNMQSLDGACGAKMPKVKAYANCHRNLTRSSFT